MPEIQGKRRYRINRETGRLELGKLNIPVPASRPARVALGGALVTGGIFGFLPVVGFWMLPLGVIILSHDMARVRRLRRRVSIWWGRRGRDGEGGNGSVTR